MTKYKVREYILLKKFAKARTVETPLMLMVPAPSSIRLSQEAHMTMASTPDARGDDIMAYAFVPLIA